MKLSWKIYITFFIFFVVIAFLTSYIIVVKRISDAEKWIVEENKALGNFLSNEIEVGYLKLNWPFESLRRLSEYKSFLFWWVIKDDGTIYLSDNTSFMGTYAYDYFPQVANMIEDENVVLNRSQNYGIFIKPLETGGKKWSFWFGFSLKEASEIRKEIIFMILTGSMSALIVLGFIFYFTIKHFTKPINDLIIGTEIIGKGDLTHRVKIKSRDELGQLANSFNKMTDDLQKTTVSKDYVDNIIRNMVDSLIVVNLDGKIKTINRATEELLGYNEKELIGQPIGTVIEAEEFSLFSNPKIDEIIINSSSLNVERTYVSKDGRKIPVLFSGSVMFDNDGKAQGIVCVAQDITEQKQTLEALKESEEKYRLVFENAKEGICIYEDFPDGNRKLVDCNSRYVEMSGYSREELMQISDTLKIQQDHRTPDQEATGVDKAWAGQPYSGVFSWHRPDGKENYIEYTAVSLDIDDRRFTIGIDHDITERKQAEDELKKIAEKLTRSNTELEQFAYVASHDLQEPLRMVASYVQLLARRYKGKLDTDADDFIGYAVDGANRMQRLINDLLTYSRVSTRGRDFKPTNCETVFDQVLDNLQVAIEESDAVVTHDPLPTVMADDVQLVQLFQNLISNAIKFHGEQPSRVHVSTEQKENEWIFSVRDNGIGIEPEYFDRIFIIFQRLHSKREYSGTGIGLSICKKIVERHGGGIWVESQFGKGATFYFTIPMRGDE
jgi:PAS domain S-box-containing protein